MIIDAHCHIIEPNFPLIENQGFIPDPFTVSDYIHQTHAFDVRGGVIVSGSFQGEDTTYLSSCLKQLGPSFVGVVQLPDSVTDREIKRLHTVGVRAVRFNLKRGCYLSIEAIEQLAHRVYDLCQWHAEFYIDSVSLMHFENNLLSLPAISIDHLGLSCASLPIVYQLAEAGCRVKATGFGRVDFDPLPVLKKLHAINETCLLFGTDLPSTRAKVPFSEKDVVLITDNFTPSEVHRIMYQNAYEFYKL